MRFPPYGFLQVWLAFLRWLPSQKVRFGVPSAWPAHAAQAFPIVYRLFQPWNALPLAPGKNLFWRYGPLQGLLIVVLSYAWWPWRTHPNSFKPRACW